MAAYKEDAHIGLWITGKRVVGSWAHADEDSSFYELKAYVDNLFRRLGVVNNAITTKVSDNNIFSDGLTLEDRTGKVLLKSV